MSRLAVLLGNQLFSPKHLKSLEADKFFMAEDLDLCTYYRHHKLKIIFFICCMRDFRDEIQKDFSLEYLDCKHRLFSKTFEEKLLASIKRDSIKELVLFEVEDKFMQKRLQDFAKQESLKLHFVKSPMFLNTRQDFKDYLKEKKKAFMKTFYERNRKKFNVLLDPQKKPLGGRWSFDESNRKKIPKDYQPPQLTAATPSPNLNKVKNWVEENFKQHPGDSTSLWLPTTRKEALAWLEHFVQVRLENFGNYQDAITRDHDFLNHSLLAPLINIGLITPEEVLEACLKETLVKKIPINSLEGFVRQVLGWREFVRGIYQNFSEEQESKNFWNHSRKLNPCWYDGSTGIELLDDAIKKAWRLGYTHHIERLMILSNFMLLCEVDPQEAHRWFMEMHIDSSDWVMGPNVYGMGQFSDGGIFATKPYTCGSNYYLKMSRYSKGSWTDIADGLYWSFIDKHRDFYSKNPRMSFMLSTLDKMPSNKKERIYKAAEKFKNKVTSKK